MHGTQHDRALCCARCALCCASYATHSYAYSCAYLSRIPHTPAGLHAAPQGAMDVYKGHIVVYDLLCSPLLESNESSAFESCSVVELQRMPALGLSDLSTISIAEEVAASTSNTSTPRRVTGVTRLALLAAACRQAQPSISVYDQMSYVVPSLVYRWDFATSRFQVLQVLQFGLGAL